MRKYSDAYWDHERDLRKHDFDTEVPLCAQSAPFKTAMEVAILAQAVSLPQAAELIEAYARAEAAGARVEATATAINRCCEAIEKHGEKTDA